MIYFGWVLWQVDEQLLFVLGAASGLCLEKQAALLHSSWFSSLNFVIVQGMHANSSTDSLFNNFNFK